MDKARAITGKDGAEMLLIPAGEFEITEPFPGPIPEFSQWGKKYFSVNASRFQRGTLSHKLYLDAFYIDVYEVTNAQYKKFMDATGHSAPSYWKDSRFNAPDQPIVGVSWHDAVAYAEWAGKRLPTEAEWEKAASGGLVDRKFPCGDTDPDGTQCNYADKNTSRTWSDKNADEGYEYAAPVGSYPPNGYGLYDIAGNVSEWCADRYESFRVLRGGNLPNDAHPFLVASRRFSEPDATSHSIGFRCGASRGD